MENRIVKVGDLAIDRQLRLLTGPLRMVKTTNFQLRLLLVFVENRKDYIPTDKLIQEMWLHPDYEPDHANNSLTTHICNLRKNLVKTGTTVRIVNNHGKGYMLTTEQDDMVVRLLTPDLAAKFDHWVATQNILAPVEVSQR